MYELKTRAYLMDEVDSVILDMRTEELERFVNWLTNDRYTDNKTPWDIEE